MPLAMLAAAASIGGFELLARRFGPWSVAVVMIAAAWTASFDQLSYPVHGGESSSRRRSRRSSCSPAGCGGGCSGTCCGCFSASRSFSTPVTGTV
ncbi:MAG: hypothetical protein L6W00_06075 [Lentisphaeria bacterium]|nr:MAG: hypothetical protein L6W00_06075 [Lentisphaeria bacterium]